MSEKAVEKRKDRILKFLRDAKNPSKRSIQTVISIIGNSDNENDFIVMSQALSELIDEDKILETKDKNSSKNDRKSGWVEYNPFPKKSRV